MLLENLLDSSHVPFTHHQTISKRENAVPLPLALTRRLSPGGFAGRFQRPSAAAPNAAGFANGGNGATGDAAAAAAAVAQDTAGVDPAGVDPAGFDPAGFQGRVTERTTVFHAPAYMHHRIQTAGADGSLASGFETWTVRA
jgi:phenylpropionate dioxygenase-like ring-hydroxylating dioxygenase large terminal subunit